MCIRDSRKANHVGSFLDRDHHFMIRRGKLDCVRKQVGNDLEQPVRIGSHVSIRTRGFKPNSYAIAFGESPIGRDCLRNQWPNFDAAEIEGHTSRLHLLDIQNIDVYKRQVMDSSCVN